MLHLRKAQAVLNSVCTLRMNLTKHMK